MESSANSLRLSLSTRPAMRSSSSELLQSPFDKLNGDLSDADLRVTAYEIFVAVCLTTSGKPLTHISHSERAATPASVERSPSPLLSMQRSMTSTAAGKMKKALGLNSTKKNSGKDSSSWKAVKRPATIGELIRVQMGVSEPTDSRIRRGLMRISSTQLGRRIESIVLPLELLLQFKASDFPDQQEYEAWRRRNLKVLEAGLILHPLIPLEKSDVASQRLRKIIHGASENPIDTGMNSDSVQVLRSTVMSLASRTPPGFPFDVCHWADGSPLNLNLYQMLLEVLFDYHEGSVIEEIDEVLESIKKTWVVLGLNQMIHNLCFLWFLFRSFVIAGQADIDLLLAADNQLLEVAKDAKTINDPLYSKILSSSLSSIMGWTEKRLLAYHDTFNSSNIELMQYLVSLGVSTAKILVDIISQEYRRKRREEVDVARSRIDTYIRSSLRTAFAQMMEKVDSIKRSSRSQNAPFPVLSILANDINDLAKQEKEIYSPILKRWHPQAAGVAVATLHSCYGNELKQFVSGVTDLTFDSIQVLKSAHKLEKDLVQIAVEDSVDSEDGGKGIIREMPPYEAESAISSLTKSWVKARVESLGESVERNAQHEAWSPTANKESFAPSSVEVLRLVDEMLDAFFQLPIPSHLASIPDLIVGLDRVLQYYVAKAKAGCGTRNTFVPALPALTRVDVTLKLWKKKEISQNVQRRKSLESIWNGGSSSLAQCCVRMNTLHHIQTELENLEKKISTCLKKVESSQTGLTNSFANKFELTLVACEEGIRLLCETTAYKLIFHDLSHVLWDFLYVREISSSRIHTFLKELDPNLVTLSNTVHNGVRNHAITALMKASFDGFLLVLLAGGPSRAFIRQDSQIFEDDFKALKDLYFADGDGLPVELVEKTATQVKSVLPLFRAETESLIVRFKQIIMETYGPSVAKSRYPLPETSGQWSPTDANTVLRVLCYRNDEAASKFLKKTYSLAKKL